MNGSGLRETEGVRIFSAVERGVCPKLSRVVVDKSCGLGVRGQAEGSRCTREAGLGHGEQEGCSACGSNAPERFPKQMV